MKLNFDKLTVNILISVGLFFSEIAKPLGPLKYDLVHYINLRGALEHIYVICLLCLTIDNLVDRIMNVSAQNHHISAKIKRSS